MKEQTDPADAWQAVVLAHEPWLHAYVAGRLRDSQAAEDVVQEVLVAAIELPDSGEAIREPQAWLRTVATRQVALHLRSGERRQRRETQAPVRRSEPPAPLDVMLRNEEAGLVNRALAELDPDVAELLRLKYVEGWTYKEIGKHLGRSWNEIAHRLVAAREALRQRLTNLLDDDSETMP